MSRNDYHNTGKVKIGLLHSPGRRMADFGHYELQVQRAMLAPPVAPASTRAERFKTLVRSISRSVWNWL